VNSQVNDQVNDDVSSANENASERSAKPAKPSPVLADYPHRVKEIIRYADLDPQGHVNNVTFGTYFETGRVAMIRTPDLGIGIADATFVLVRMEIDFLRELRWPGEVTVGTAIARFGRTSFIATQAVFDGETCAAAGRATMVMMDTTTRRPRPLNDVAMARLSPWKLRGA
jgi:acyl-CoA thioester hydrolase